MFSYVQCDKITVDALCKSKLEKLYLLYMQHKFNLLGSGFVKVNYKLRAKGIHGKRYISLCMARYERIAYKKLHYNKVMGIYEPINWFLDYKSGFFFNPVKYCTVRKCQKIIGKYEGVDIKCPWELGRFYHFVQLSVLAISDVKYRESIILEFKNEIIDFIVMNPVGKTVQWATPMDVSIRIVNLLLSYDILHQLDKNNYLDSEFKNNFHKLIEVSLKFVIDRLEYSGKGCGSNHYLSNIVGIIFAAAYLPDSPRYNAYLVFGVQELIEQVKKQFYLEGGHFEGSTSYHRLSAEFVIYATALVYGVLKTKKRNAFLDYKFEALERLKRLKCQKYNLKTKEFFPQWYIDRIYNMGVFTKTILKENNEIVQIGDNDSGRLIKLTPMGIGSDDISLDHRTLISEIAGIFNTSYFDKEVTEIPLEHCMVSTLAAGKKVEGNIANTKLVQYGIYIGNSLRYIKETVVYKEFPKSINLLENIEINYYKDFGILVFKGKRLFLNMVIDTAGSKEFPGHTHNDKLSIEVMIDGKYITRDSGGYIYTADSYIRDKFRSVKAHNTIHVREYEQNIFTEIFGMQVRTKATLVYCSKNRIIGRVKYADIEHIREIQITNNAVVVKDYANRQFSVGFTNKIYSTEYGRIERSRKRGGGEI